MLSNHVIRCCPLFLLPSIFSSIRVFSNELALCIRWPKYWSFSFSNSTYNEYSVLISFRIDLFDHLAVQGTLKSLLKKWSEVAQSCPTLCDPMDCSLPGSSIPGILQAGILEWVTISFSRRSSQPRDRTWVSHIAGRCFTIIQLTLLEFLIDLVIFISRLWGPEGRICIFHVLSILKTWEAQYSCLENLSGKRSLMGYSPEGHKESGMTEQLSAHTHIIKE